MKSCSLKRAAFPFYAAIKKHPLLMDVFLFVLFSEVFFLILIFALLDAKAEL